MNILFLDVDGVLNNAKTKARCGPFIGVDPKLAGRLTGWLKDRPVSVVLSSSWRNHPEMWHCLNALGIGWIGITPFLPRGIRGVEINAWLAAHKDDVSKYAILDDFHPGMFLPDQLPQLARTNPELGLQSHHLARLNEIFG